MTECLEQRLLINLARKPVNVEFSGGNLTSDGGAILLAEGDRKFQLLERIATVIPDGRNRGYVDHSMLMLLRQRVFQIALGYEDGNDAGDMRKDPALKIACGRLPTTEIDLASQPTISRLENCIKGDTLLRLHDLMLGLFLERQIRKSKKGRLPKHMTLDLDSTCDPTHGQQEFTSFNAHYDTHMYHPIICTVGGDLLGVCLRPGNVGAAAGVLNWLPWVVARIRELRPDIQLRIRGDAGFAQPEMYDYCEAEGIEYVIGLGTNSVLKRNSSKLAQKAEKAYARTKEEQRLFSGFRYQAGSWKKSRQIVVKAEVNKLGTNVRYVVHNLKNPEPETIYSVEYCGRGAMENNIKDLKNALMADRLSCMRFEANAFRLLIHGFTYQLMSEVRDALSGTELATAQYDTIRLKLFKVAALVRESTRQVRVAISSCFPRKELWNHVLDKLAPAPS
ncbi:MAG: IS1380 family transposase [Pyrinomonadaceae bacterium]|nr:IS1380 family transposase [Pyrinomonadaceae bacterium]